jgi:hypothetical protein
MENGVDNSLNVYQRHVLYQTSEMVIILVDIDLV